ncbi:MAG: TCP-1/cpn60 chaperonin family protein, partial [Candidatus Baldrarchaeia archaeon]
DLSEDALGYAELVEERKVADDKMVFVEGCKNPRAVSILVRGGSEHVVDEAERSLHDALCVVRNLIEEPKILPGGGAVELEVSRKLKEFAETLGGREQLAVKAFAEALEVIPRTLAENGGLDPIDMMAELRSRHEKGEWWVGVDLEEGKVGDMREKGVWEPLSVKRQAIAAASEVAQMILRIDDVIAAAEFGKEKEKGKGEEKEEETGSEF